MKSLSISTATAAVAISLASSASANEARPYVMPEIDAMLFVDDVSPEATAEIMPSATNAVGPVLAEPLTPPTILPAAATPMPLPAINAQVTADGTAPAALLKAAFAYDVPQGQLTLPVTQAPTISDAVVTTRSLVPQGVDARYGDIGAFWGDIIAFYGDIDAFWGDISPFYGDISPFYGDISPFYGDISPFYGDIGAFWGDISPFYGDIGAFAGSDIAEFGDFWKKAGAHISSTEANWSSLRYTIGLKGDVNIVFDGTPNKILASFETLIAQAEAQFGAAYEEKTGKSFRDGFVADILARHELDLANSSVSKETLAKSDAERAAFYLDWHDSLNQYSGIDAVDHWMGAINWTPSITQIQGNGRDTAIGIVDGSFAKDADLGNNVVWSGGGTSAVGGHGAGVASLIAGAHDGEGVMGIAPDVNIASYNPFDANGNTSWDMVADGVVALKTKGNAAGDVSIINLSLGEPGHIFTNGTANFLYRSDVDNHYNDTVFVFAAGNEGIVQNTSIEFNDADETALIFVGSLGLDGQISDFSNRPGDACLLDGGKCYAGNRLMDRFIVAPGELILVSDGQGGVVRRSGTSFSAPLVSGAISLLHDRWQWLADKPEETTEIIFRSARDLGAPGVDEVYGHGLLDVAASQSPLNFNELKFTLYQRSGNSWRPQGLSAAELLQGGIPDWWETQDVFFTGYEEIGDTYRDFSIPVSAFTFGKSTNALGRGFERLQDFVSGRFAKWLVSKGNNSSGGNKAGFSQVQSNEQETTGEWSMRFDAIQPEFGQDGAMRNVHSAATLTNPQGNMSFTLGHGQGALALAGNNFGIISDHDHEIGGVNPVLGFASGETFAGATYKPAKATTVSVGFSAQREDWRDLNNASEIDRNLQRVLGAREAEALTVGVEQQVAKGFTINAQYTRLRENDAVLGAQTTIDALLGEGSRTNAVTVSASMDIGDGFSFDLSATGGATQTAEGQLLATSNDVMSTAGQFTVNKRGVMGGNDILRVSVGQPLTIEKGELELRSDQVVDRLTGERGVVTQTIGINTARRYTGQIVYATPMSDSSELGLIGRYISAGDEGQDEAFMIGANFGLRF